MRAGTPSGPSHKKSLSAMSIQELLPSGALFLPSAMGRESVTSTLLAVPKHSDCASYAPHDISHCSSMMRRSQYVLGVVSGESSKHFLVRSNATWIPVLKTSFFSSTGERLTGITFKELKNKKVRLSNTSANMPEAHLEDGEEGSRMDHDIFADRIPDFETDAGFSEEESSKALESHVALSAELLTDVVAMAALGADPQRTKQYFRQRAPRLRKSVDEAMATLKSADTALFTAMRPTCTQLLSNVELLTREAKAGCSRCKIAQSRVTLSCQHVLCLNCAKELVAFKSGTDFELQHCPLCKRELSLTDMRLILLEKYEALKKGMKHVNAIGIDLSRINPLT